MKHNNAMKTVALVVLLIAAGLFSFQNAAADNGFRVLSQDAGIDLLGYGPDVEATNSIGFSAALYACDLDGWAIGEPRTMFAADEEFCVKGSFSGGAENETHSIIAEWEDGFGNTQLSLGKNMMRDTEMHWSFSYYDPESVSANFGKVTLKTYDTCEILGVYPIEMNTPDNPQPIFVGAAYRCQENLMPNLDEPTVAFMADEKACVSGEVLNLAEGETIDLDFVWSDGLSSVTTVSYDDASAGDQLNIYYYYETPENVSSNSGWVTVMDRDSGLALAALRVNFINTNEFVGGEPEPLGFEGAVYHCDEDNYSTGHPSENFRLDENFCLSGSILGGNENWTSNVLFDWEDGQDNSTLLLGKDYIPGTIVNWYYYYYNPSLQQKNMGEVIVKDYDTCNVLNLFPVNMGYAATFDAGTGL